MTDRRTDTRAGTRRRATIRVRVLRQDAPGEPSYWERHRIAREPDMNVISVLQRIAAQAETVDGETVAAGRPGTATAWKRSAAPARWSINGRVRQACSALVDKLLADHPDEIELRPMAKFPVVRDLVVNRRRLFRAPGKSRRPGFRSTAITTLGSGPRISPRPARASLSAERVHELRLLPGSLPAILEDRVAAPRRAKPTSNLQAREQASRSTAASSGPMRSAR